MPRRATVPPFSSSTARHRHLGDDVRFRHRHGALVHVGDAAVGGDEQHVERNERVLHPERPRPAVSGKTNSMPASGASVRRNISPCSCCTGVSASSIEKCCAPCAVSIVRVAVSKCCSCAFAASATKASRAASEECARELHGPQAKEERLDHDQPRHEAHRGPKDIARRSSACARRGFRRRRGP